MITIERAGITLPFKEWLFPDGCVGLNLDVECYKFWHSDEPITVTARINSANDFMQLVMAINAIRMRDDADILLFMPFLPYSRQDRICADGDPFSLLAFGELINSLDVKTMLTLDPHSNVAAGIFRRFRSYSQLEVVQNYDQFATHCRNSVLVAPDAGAVKKTAEVAVYLGLEMIQAHKVREVSTGAILKTEILGVNNIDYPCVIVDDICDGGRTFIELAKELKQLGCPHITLYVTHGIFSKGTGCIYSAGIDKIFTTNSVYHAFPSGVSHKVQVMDVKCFTP